MNMANEIEKNKQLVSPTSTQSLIQDLRQIVEQARCRVALKVNAELTMMYWHIGERINREVLGNQRAEYGKQIIATVAQQLQEEYSIKGFDEKNYPKNDEICSNVSRLSNSVTTGGKIIMVSLSGSYASKR